MAKESKTALSLKKVSTHEIKKGLDLVKFLHRNENNQDIKTRLAELGDVLTRLSVNNPSTFYPRGTRYL